MSIWTAALLNIVVVLTICFLVGPRVDRIAEETQKNRLAVEENRRVITENGRDLAEHTAAVRRMTKAIDDAAARLKPNKKGP